MNSPVHAVCLHGHFYQPPRENPWTGKISVQPSAAPFHDWNERVTAECYAPNAHARILDAQQRILEITNNYQHISFNIGPTLLAWLQARRPDVYEAILEADRLGQRHFSGHGPALAQVYHHLIMPLANTRDQHTQVIWGLRDFEARFGRQAEGMWLAETAVDINTLEALAAHDVKFTILAPHQAHRVRPRGGDAHQWFTLDGNKNIDTSVSYVQYLPSGKSIAIFFYDGPTSRAVAFEKLLDDGQGFARRLISDLCLEDDTPQLEHIATDGESYGHHHTYGEMALAYALRDLRQRQDVSLTVYGEWLAHHPPTMEVEIRDETSWSCAHGVERWRSDCGCHTGGESGSNQLWRAPLRAALDHLRDAAIELFTSRSSTLFHDAWGARERYIEVMLDPSCAPGFFGREFAGEHPPDAESIELMRQLMELQRHAMMMYTSCGWFFHDLAGIETVQILRYAARALELYEALGGEHAREGFFAHLSRAQAHDGRTGVELFEQEVHPLMGGKAQSIPGALDLDIRTSLETLTHDPTNPEALDALHRALLRRHDEALDLSIEPYQNLFYPCVMTLRTRSEELSDTIKKKANQIIDLIGFSSELFI